MKFSGVGYFKVDHDKNNSPHHGGRCQPPRCFPIPDGRVLCTQPVIQVLLPLPRHPRVACAKCEREPDPHEHRAEEPVVAVRVIPTRAEARAALIVARERRPSFVVQLCALDGHDDV